MRVISLQDLEREIEKRRSALGIVDTEESLARLRNSGRRRTSEKRAMLRRLKGYADQDGVPSPFKANF